MVKEKDKIIQKVTIVRLLLFHHPACWQLQYIHTLCPFSFQIKFPLPTK